jgi:hypothetical protein
MGYRTQKPRVEWREDKVRMGMVLARKGIGIQPGFIPEPEAYAMLHCSPECPAICRNAFLRGVPRAHRYHATVLV